MKKPRSLAGTTVQELCIVLRQIVSRDALIDDEILAMLTQKRAHVSRLAKYSHRRFTLSADAASLRVCPGAPL